MDLEPNGSNSAASWVAGKIVVLNEMLPGTMRSDDAAKLYLKLMIKIASEVGQARFNAAVEKAIETLEHRRPTIATMRRLCGLASIEPSEAALAWILVTTVVTKHLRYNGDGAVIIAPNVRMVNGARVEDPPPIIPSNVLRAVIALGGWQSMAESFPAYWSQRFQNFRELYWTSPAENSIERTPHGT